MCFSFRNQRNENGYVHAVFIGDPRESPVCGIVKKLEPGWYEWVVRDRNGNFDTRTNRYRPSLIRCGYDHTRERAIRKMVDYLKEGEWHG